MTVPYVTLAAAKLYLRVDGFQEDAIIALMIEAACEAVRDTADNWVQYSNDPVPARITLAVLAHVANAYDNRPEADRPASATALLTPFRKLDV